jgi:hypothetical protein
LILKNSGRFRRNTQKPASQISNFLIQEAGRGP